jgi:hypothetical protein
VRFVVCGAWTGFKKSLAMMLGLDFGKQEEEEVPD